MRRRLAAVPLTALLLGVAACGGSDSSASDPASDSSPSSASQVSEVDGLTVSGDFGEQPKVKVTDLDVDKAQSSVLVEGDGPEIAADDTVNYRFYIVYGSNGKPVSNNFTEPAPQKLDLAKQPPVITDAVVGQKIGSRVALAVPVPDLVGKDGASQLGLDAKNDLVLVMDLIDEAAAPLDGPQGKKVDAPAGLPTVEEKDGDVTGLDFGSAPAKAPSKLQVVPLVEGTGKPVEEGDSLTIDYYGAVWGADKAFDESYGRGEPATFTLTQGSLIDGWVQGLQGVKAGSRVMLVIPPEQGYGAQGSGSTIPPNSSLVFVIDVLGVNL